MGLSTGSHDITPGFERLLLKNSFDELMTLSNWVNQLATQYRISTKATFRLDLVLAETVTNILENAYDDEEEHEIVVTFECVKNTVRIQVSDDGLPFDPLQSLEKEMPGSLEEAEEGGLGIHLIRSYTDECIYQREGSNNILTMVICDSM